MDIPVFNYPKSNKHLCIVYDTTTRETIKEYVVYGDDFYFVRKKALLYFQHKVIPYVKKYRDKDFDYKVDSIELSDTDFIDEKTQIIL